MAVAPAAAADVTLGNGDLVVRLRPDGGLREISARGALRERDAAAVPVSGTLEIVRSRPERRTDAASFAWSGGFVEGTSVLALRGAGDGLAVDLHAFLVPGKNLLALHYVVSGEIESLRYVIRFGDDAGDAGRTPHVATISSTRALALGVARVGIGADPPGAPPERPLPGALALDVDRHADVTFFVGIGDDAALEQAVLDATHDGPAALEPAARSRDAAFLESGVRIAEPAAWGAVLDRALLGLRDAQAEDGALAAWRGGGAAAIALELSGHGDLAARFARSGLERTPASADAVFAGAHHGLASDDRAFLEEIWPALRRGADALAARIDGVPGLLVGADDWISNEPGFALVPNVEVVAALRAAGFAAEKLGHADDAGRWRERARTLAGRVLTDGYDRDARRFVPRIGFPADDRVDAAMLLLARSDVFAPGTGTVAPDQPRFAATVSWIERGLLNVDGTLSAFEPNPRAAARREGSLEASARATAWLAEIDFARGWARDGAARLDALASLARASADAPDETVAALLAGLACARPAGAGAPEIVVRLGPRRSGDVRNLAAVGRRLDVAWSESAKGSRVVLRSRDGQASRRPLRLVVAEGSFVAGVNAKWSRDGRDAVVEADVPAEGERALDVEVRTASSIVQLSHPERWRSPCILMVGDAPIALKNAAESLRETLAVARDAAPLLVNFRSTDIGLAGRDLIVVGDPRDQPRAPEFLRNEARAMPSAPNGTEEFLLARKEANAGNLTVLAGRDDRRLILAIDELTRRIRDAALAPIVASAEARLAERGRRIEALVEGVAREWRVSSSDGSGAGRATTVRTHVFGELRLDDAALGDAPGPVTASVFVRSATARPAVLWVGSTTAAEIAWNDRPAGSVGGTREWRLDAERVPVAVDAGWNHVVVRVASPKGASLSLRVGTAAGGALPGVELRATEK
jgi:hypothetical protein